MLCLFVLVALSVLRFGFDWQRPFWLVFMKVVVLPCYTQVFALGSFLKNVDSGKCPCLLY